MIKKELLAYSLLVIQPIFMASNLVVARGGVEFIPPISLAFWRWLTVFLILLIFNYTIFSKKKIILKEYKKLFFFRRTVKNVKTALCCKCAARI